MPSVRHELDVVVFPVDNDCFHLLSLLYGFEK